MWQRKILKSKKLYAFMFRKEQNRNKNTVIRKNYS